MPNTKSAKKRLRQNDRRRLRNRSLRSEIRTHTRRILETESAEEVEGALSRLYTLLDRAANKRILHPNAAARRKARVARHLRKLAED
ncbi:MAG: 30S ribosomal protein S20 [Gemmatimonadota bacterium]